MQFEWNVHNTKTYSLNTPEMLRDITEVLDATLYIYS